MTALPNRPSLDETIEHLAMYFDSPQVRAVYGFSYHGPGSTSELRETLQECQQRHAENIAASALRLLPQYTSHPKCSRCSLHSHYAPPRIDRRRWFVAPRSAPSLLDFIKDTARLWLNSPEEAS